LWKDRGDELVRGLGYPLVYLVSYFLWLQGNNRSRSVVTNTGLILSSRHGLDIAR
jgi:hypothetical protein